MPNRNSLTRAEGDLILSLLEQPNSCIVGSAMDELGFDADRLVSSGMLQPIGTMQSVFTGDGAEAGFRDLARVDGSPPGYFDAADGMVFPPVGAITLYKLDLRWWLKWLVDALDLVDAGNPAELVPDHAWDIGNLWVTDKTKVPVLFARRVHGREIRDRIRLALNERTGRSGGVLLTSSRRNSEVAPWPGGHHCQPLHNTLTSCADEFEIDLGIINSPYMPGQMARPEMLVDLSPDNRVLTIRGETMMFRGAKQQLVLRQLVEGYRGRTHVRSIALFAHFADDVDTLSKAFKGSPNWPILQRYLHQKDGLCWIEA